MVATEEEEEGSIDMLERESGKGRTNVAPGPLAPPPPPLSLSISHLPRTVDRFAVAELTPSTPLSHTLLHKHSNSFEWNERKRFDGRLNLKKLISAHHAGTGPRNLHQQLVVVVPWNGCVSRRHPPMIDDVPIRRGAQKHIYTEAVRFV